MNNKNIKNITVVIPTLNRNKSLKDTLLSIFKEQTLPKEMIIVDQSDADDYKLNQTTIDDFSNNYKTSIIHASCDFKSLTKARNYGLRLASNDFVLFLDDDVDFHNDVIDRICNYLERDEIGLVGCINCKEKLYMPSIRSQLIFGIDKNIKTEGKISKSVMGFFPSAINQFTETEWAMGFCFAIKKSISTNNNVLFDEKLVAYGYAEDFDFSYRYISVLKRNGMKGIFCSDAIIEHLISSEYRTPSQKTACMFLANRLYLFYKLSFPKRWLTHYRLANMVYSKSFRKDRHMRKWFKTAEKRLLKYYKDLNDFFDLDSIYNTLIKEG